MSEGHVLRPKVKALVRRLQERIPPDMETVLSYLQPTKGNVTEEERAIVMPLVLKAYGAQKEGDLYRLLQHEETWDEDFAKVLRKIELTGWLRDYLQHLAPLKSSEAYNFGCGLALVSAMIRREVRYWNGFFETIPCVKVFLTGSSGIGKTVCFDNAKAMLKATETELVTELPTTGSVEGFIAVLSEMSNRNARNTEDRVGGIGLWAVDEFARFVNLKDYNKELVQVLTFLFNNPAGREERRLVSRTYSFQDVTITGLFTSNEDALKANMPAEVFGGGLFSRMLIFHQEEPRLFDAVPPKPPPGEREQVATSLVDMTRIAGEATLESAAEKLYQRYVEEYAKMKPDDDRLIGMWNRLRTHVLQIAILLSISDDPRQRGGVLVTERHLWQAHEILLWIYKGTPYLYDWINTSDASSAYKRITRIIEKHGNYITDRALRRATMDWMDGRKLSNYLLDLQLAGLIEQTAVDDFERETDSKAWRLTLRGP